MNAVTVVGAGLAGSEAAYQLAIRGIPVRLIEMKPKKMTPAHVSPYFAELVCSNSLRSDELTNAVGLLKEELRRLGSIVMRCADEHRVAAGGALAVDREGFARAVTEAVRALPNVEIIEEEAMDIPDGEVIIASGPLTSDALAENILRRTGSEGLHFYDAVAPIVSLDSVDMESAFRLVVRRGQLMQACAEAHSGSMAAVLRLPNETVEALCASFSHVYPVNYNCAGQLTVAGDSAEMPAFIKAVTESGGRAVPLAVSGAFHSPFMTEASDGLAAYLASVELREPALPLYANLTARPYAGDLRATLAAQVKSPVRWEETVRHMADAGADFFCEVGPGKVLSGLIRRILPEAQVFNVENAETLALCVQAAQAHDEKERKGQ